MEAPKSRFLVQFLLVFLLPLIVYSSAVNYPFQFDDRLFLKDENVQLGRWTHFVLPPISRVLTWLTFLFQYQLHGALPSPFHAFNLFLHAVNSGLAFWILNLARPGRRRLATTSQLSTQAGIEGSDPDPAVAYSSWIPFVGGLVFALHPIQTEAVLYVYQRSTLLATLFGFLALIAHLKGQPVRVLLYFGTAVPRRA